jgi:hypothetical protein
MIELFQITGSASFAVRAALEEGAIPYVTVDVHPRRPTEAPSFAGPTRPAIARTRELEDLDDRLQRFRPGLRAGQPI